MTRFLTIVFPLITLLLAASSSPGQGITNDLNGFTLGQHRSVTHRELGGPDKQGNNDENIEYEAFLLTEEPMLYMVFQYQKSEPKTIWSIQITGNNAKHDLGFLGLRMGMSAAEVEKKLGKPERKINVPEHGTRWEFEKHNYSIEIGPENTLSSIRIVDERSKEPDLKNLPKFVDVSKILQSGTNADLAQLFAPDMEIYDAGRVISFQWAMKNEITNDRSGVFSTVRRLAKELASVDPSKPDQYEESMRLRLNRDPLHVIKLWKLKSIPEIAFKWNGAKWQIWELGAKMAAPPPQDWKSIYTPGNLKELVSKRIPELIKNPNVAMTKDDGKPLAGFSYNSYPTSTTVKFTGETRRTPESTLTLISLWLTTIGKSKELAKQFEFEFKVVENGVEYWLPIQHPIPERLTKEAKKDDEITIYLSWIGIKYEGDRPELLAIVNEFTAAPK